MRRLIKYVMASLIALSALSTTPAKADPLLTGLIIGISVPSNNNTNNETPRYDTSNCNKYTTDINLNACKAQLELERISQAEHDQWVKNNPLAAEATKAIFIAFITLPILLLVGWLLYLFNVFSWITQQYQKLLEKDKGPSRADFEQALVEYRRRMEGTDDVVLDDRDFARLKEALASPRIMAPSGMNREEKRAFILEHADNKQK